MPESSCFRTPFQSQIVHGCKTLPTKALQHFYPNFQLIQAKFIWKTSNLAGFEILRLFGNTLMADHMYSRHRWGKFRQQVQTLLCQQLKKCSRIFIAILQSTQNFPHFQRKDQFHSINILKFIDRDKCGYFNAQKLRKTPSFKRGQIFDW